VIGRADLYGKAMLRAIDWALTPDENLRPRRVADFRRACLPAAGQPARKRRLAGGAAGARQFAQPKAAASSARSSSATCRSPTPADAAAEAAHKERRQPAGDDGQPGGCRLPASSRLAANTREGCAVCYVGDPEDALRTATPAGRGGE
jgi:hypothetical protein